MIMPKKLKILGHTVTVKDTEEDVTHSGQWTCSKNLIEINTKYPPSQQEAALLHEIIHALNYNLTEEQVEWIAGGIHQVIVDNNLTFTGK